MSSIKIIFPDKFWLLLFLFFALPHKVLPVPLQDHTRLFKEAFEHANNHQYTRAVRSLRDILARDPSLTEAYFWLADYLHYAKSYDLGKSLFAELESTSGQNPNANLALAALYKHESDWINAFKQSILALERHSTSFQAVALLIESAIKLKRTDALAAKLRSFKKVPEQAHLYDLGYTFWRINIESYKKAQDTIEGYLETNAQDLHAHSLLGDILLAEAEYRKALSQYRLIIDAKGKSRDRFLMQILPKVSQCYFEIGEIDSALHYLDAAVKLGNERGALIEQAQIALTLHTKLKENALHKELEMVCASGINALKWINEVSTGVDLYSDLALCRTLVGDFEEAASYYDLAYQAAQGNIKKMGHSSFALGELALHQSDESKARRLFERAQNESEKAGDRPLLNQILLAQARLYAASNDRDAAKRKIDRVLRHGQRTQRHDLTELGFVELAHLFMQSPPDLDKAQYYLAMADALARQIFKLNFSANHRWMQGNIALIERDVELAETLYSDAVQLGLETGSHLAYLAGQAGLIRTYLSANFPELASSRADTAMAYFDKYYNFCIEEFGIAYFDLKQDFFEPAIEAYSRVGELEKMYDACDKYKSQKHFQNISNLPLITSYQPLKNIIIKVQQKRNQITELWRVLWDGRRVEADFDAKTKKRIRRLYARQDSLLRRLQQENPRIYNLVTPTNLSLQDLQIQLTQLNSAYIHYFFGKFASYAIVIEPNDISCKRINLRGDYIENLAKDVAPLFNNAGSNFAEASQASDMQFRVDNAGQLYKILIEPVKPWITGKKNLIISGDGSLNDLPFELLVTNQDALLDPFDYVNARFLVEEYATSYVPFSTLINTIAKGTKPKKLMLILAAPEVNSDKGSSSGANGTNIESESIWQALGRRQIVNLENRLTSKVEYLKRQKHFQILHLALPGVLMDRNPLTSFLVFPKQPENRMAVHELFGQNLSAELAVLTRLERQLDHQAHGAGLAAMLQGFNFAGVPSIVTSLWPATAGNRGKILEEFYGNLKLGSNKAEALQQAKIKYLQEENRNPYYWAYLTLNGTPAAVKFENNQQYLLVYMTIVGLLLLITLFVRQFHKFLKEEKASQVEAG